MILWKFLPFSRRVAFVYILAICVLFILHFRVADDFTYNHSKHYSAARYRFGFLGDGFQKLISLNTPTYYYPRLSPANHSEGSGEYTNINDSISPVSKSRSTETYYISNKPLKFVVGEEAAGFRREDSFDNIKSKEVRDTSIGALPPLFNPPKGEAAVRRYPQCVIIGFTKCGTRALIEFMSFHPYIKVARNEVHFYDRDEVFDRGYDWYKQQMPLSYSTQITVEKTPAYVLTQRARDEMVKITPDVKLILLVRDPVVRLVSQFLLRFRSENPDDQTPISVMYKNNTTGLFDPEMRPVDIGNYQKHINMWLQRFPFRQMLILNSEDLTHYPLYTMKRVEWFLQIPSLFSERNVFYNQTSDFYCPRGFEHDALPRCLGKTKGLTHPNLSPEDKVMLYDYYKPYNEKLFSLLGYRINWTEKDWGKKEA